MEKKGRKKFKKEVGKNVRKFKKEEERGKESRIKVLEVVAKTIVYKDRSIGPEPRSYGRPLCVCRYTSLFAGPKNPPVRGLLHCSKYPGND